MLLLCSRRAAAPAAEERYAGPWREGFTTSTLERAIEIAVHAHAGRVDKAGAPYILHALRVMLRQHDPAARAAAVLHDVVEDSPWTLEQLRAEGFGDDVVGAVDALTHRPDESYEDYLKRASRHAIARRVKLADLEDNLDLTRISQPTEQDLARLARYRWAWEFLQVETPTG
jgi:(p)ppGpp synthase/HD superfamily hydrolase